MWQRISAITRDWSILIVALLVIAGLFYLASHQGGAPQQSASTVPPAGQTSASAPSSQQASQLPPAGAPANQAQSRNSPADASPGSEQGKPAQQAGSEQPAAPESHGHAAAKGTSAQQQAQTTGQAGAAPQSPQQSSRSANLSPEAAAGRQVFRKCQACHSLQAGKNLVGPSLAGIIGRKAGSEPGFDYSPAMKQADMTWDAKNLDAYLADPQKVVPGNKMPFPGLKSEHDRKDVIAFLSGSSSSGQAAAADQAKPQNGPVAGTQTGNASQASGTPPASGNQAPGGNQPSTGNQAPGGTQPPQANASQPLPAMTHAMPDMPDVKYTLRSGIAEGLMVYIGVGGAIDGKVNPTLSAAEGQVVQITLINGEGAEHDIVFPDQNSKSPRVTGRGASTTIAFQATKAGDFRYFCSAPGHDLAGMHGQFIVTPRPAVPSVVEADISRDPTDIPSPIGKREPQTVQVDLIATEVEARLAEATTFGFWTFNGKVPGPLVRVRVGDTIEVHLKNSAESSMVHSVDFHATTGPGGGATVLQVNPGDEKSMSFKALVPGLYVYHCATPMVAEHIANGMYGMILVEPEEGLPPVDHEFYLMQGEIYTDAPFGQHGSQEFSVEKLLNERPEYFVFNGSVGALTKLHPLHAKVGETVRFFFGVGGPNFTSSFHVIGEIFDKVYQLGGLSAPPISGIQTVTVPPGGAVVTEFKTHVPGAYSIVDHALSRAERGLAGALIVDGPENPDIYVRHGTGTAEHAEH